MNARGFKSLPWSCSLLSDHGQSGPFDLSIRFLRYQQFPFGFLTSRVAFYLRAVSFVDRGAASRGRFPSRALEPSQRRLGREECNMIASVYCLAACRRLSAEAITTVVPLQVLSPEC